MILPPRALDRCLEVHHGQTRKNGKTAYARHPIMVALRLHGAGVRDQSIIEAALLHDSVEDQPARISLDAIEKEFGIRTRGLVDDMTKEVGQTRRQYVDSFQYASSGACLIKLADRLDNLSDDFSWDEGYKVVYAKEAQALLDAMARNEDVEARLGRAGLSEVAVAYLRLSADLQNLVIEIRGAK